MARVTFPVGITRSDAMSLVLRHLRQGSIDTPDSDARLIMQLVTGATRLELITWPDVPLSDTQRIDLQAALEQRMGGTPIGRLTGCRDFWGLEFALSPDTLEPRPDSETIIEEALEWASQRAAPPRRILDLGTGSGCLLIALLNEWPEATGIGTDISQRALNMASRNAKANGIGARAHFIETTWADGLQDRFDLIVSNPPYIASAEIALLSREVRLHDPLCALDGGPDGLDAYRAIVADMRRLMAPGARAIFEIGAGQDTGLIGLAARHGFATVGQRRDIGGHIRALSLE